MQFSLEFPEVFSQNDTCYHWVSVFGISKIMHCGPIELKYYYTITLAYKKEADIDILQHYANLMYEVIGWIFSWGICICKVFAQSMPALVVFSFSMRRQLFWKRVTFFLLLNKFCTGTSMLSARLQWWLTLGAPSVCCYRLVVEQDSACLLIGCW